MNESHNMLNKTSNPTAETLNHIEPGHSVIEAEVDMGFFENYFGADAAPGEIYGSCKRISHCSCDCDRCGCLMHIT